MPNPDSVSNHPSRPLCPICQEPRSAVVAKLMPCGHIFDLECVKTLMGDPELRERCPLCRATPREVRFDFRASGYTSWSIGMSTTLLQARKRDGSTTTDHRMMSGALPAPRILQALEAPVTETQRQRTLLINRLGALPNYDPDIWIAPPEQAYMIEGQNYIIATRSFALTLAQRTVSTKTVLNRQLVISTFPIAAHNLLAERYDLASPPNPTAVANARAEIEREMAGVAGGWKIGRLILETPEMLVQKDVKDLVSTTHKVTELTRKFNFTGTASSPWTITLGRRTHLEEVVGDNGIVGGETDAEQTVDGFGYADRERAVRMARMEIQGALESVMLFAEDFRGLEEATTAILEHVGLESVECEYCPLRHRNGECMLPWVII